MDFRKLGNRLSNWGLWGEDDERGTVNYITPDKIVQAAKLVRRGTIFDLGTSFDKDGVQTGAYGRNNPLHVMTATGHGQDRPGGFRHADDYIIMPLQAGTQWDALSHVWYDNRLYNGYAADQCVGPNGASRDSITAMAKGIAGRGVLLDVARAKGVEWLEPRYEITPSDLEEAISQQGRLIVGEGDVLLLRTGFWGKFVLDQNRDEYIRESCGIGVACCEWLHERRVAALATDVYMVEAATTSSPEVNLPVHLICLRDMGLTLGEIFVLDELACDCASDGVWDFLFVAPPLKVTGAVGSPLNPLAIK